MALINTNVKVPVWLDKICAWPAMVYRKQKYGYPYRRIYLGEGEWTILDQEDYYKFGNLKWTISGNGQKFYATRFLKIAPGKTKTLRLHREIMNPPAGLLVDHRNTDTLDNRRDNLRIATYSQNSCNSRRDKSNISSRFRGVCFVKARKRWQSCTRLHGKTIFLGSFESEIDAAKAYDRAAIKYHGEFARLNFPRENYIIEGEQGKLKEDSQITSGAPPQADRFFRQILATCLICLRPGRRRGESANLT